MIEAAEIPDACPVLIGQIPLELLDFVVDPVGQRLLGNPDHGGEQMIEMYSPDWRERQVPRAADIPLRC